jgi:hypothetical protein
MCGITPRLRPSPSLSRPIEALKGRRRRAASAARAGTRPGRPDRAAIGELTAGLADAVGAERIASGEAAAFQPPWAGQSQVTVIALNRLASWRKEPAGIVAV